MITRLTPDSGRIQFGVDQTCEACRSRFASPLPQIAAFSDTIHYLHCGEATAYFVALTGSVPDMSWRAPSHFAAYLQKVWA